MAVDLAITPDQHRAVATADLARTAAAAGFTGLGIAADKIDTTWVLNVFTTLLERGWDGTVGVEVPSADLRPRPVDELVRRLCETAAPFWR